MDRKSFVSKVMGRIKTSSKLTKISFLCAVGFLIFFIITAASCKASGSFEDILIFLAEQSISLFSLSISIFVFSTGYNKELMQFCILVIPVSIVSLVFAAISIMTYNRGIREPFGYVIIGYYIMGMLYAMIVREIGILIRMAINKGDRKNIWLHILVIAICAILLPFAFFFTLASALGEDFSVI